VIKGAKGRKWFLRFRQYQQGWSWDAKCRGLGQTSGDEFFATRADAEADARRAITSHDAFALSAEFFSRVRLRGTPCQLTAEDHAAITRAGYRRSR
jgi:hypothetical protein